MRMQTFGPIGAVLLLAVLNWVASPNQASAEDFVNASSLADHYFDPLEKARRIPDSVMVLSLPSALRPSAGATLQMYCYAVATKDASGKPLEGLQVEFYAELHGFDPSIGTLTTVAPLGSTKLETDENGDTGFWRQFVDLEPLADIFSEDSRIEVIFRADVRKGPKVHRFAAGCGVG